MLRLLHAPRVPRVPRLLRIAALGVAVLWLAACGGVKIAPEPVLPKPLVQPLPAKVGVVIPADMRSYSQSETRSGVEWNIALGAGHVKLAREVFAAAFRDSQVFDDLDAARKAPGLQAIFEPRIEQYSFATARETGGDYYAVTIRYRINLLAPDGGKVDALTVTGYGNSGNGTSGTSVPLEMASRAAMRDAAAKFLTQFPDMPVAKQLAAGEALVADASMATPPLVAAQLIEAVPIHESRRGRRATP
jgi:hypothetical protein